MSYLVEYMFDMGSVNMLPPDLRIPSMQDLLQKERETAAVDTASILEYAVINRAETGLQR
jgi:hypothetical protein